MTVSVPPAEAAAAPSPIAAMLASMGTPLFSTDLFVPRYRPMRQGPWDLRIAGTILSSGYWSGTWVLDGMPVLLRQKEDGSWETWMSITPNELESQEIGVRASSGHTVILGLGMGWAAVNAALKPETTLVTVIERDPAIIDLIAAQGILDQLPAEAARKVRILQADALEWQADQPVDVLLPDIWQPLWARERANEVRQMQANIQASRIHYFGQEVEIVFNLRQAGRALTVEGIAATVAEMGLPLIGPEQEDFLPRLQAIAARHLDRGQLDRGQLDRGQPHHQ